MSGDLLEYINNRKKELNAVIMAHYYQAPEVQDLADFVGDSLQLAQQAAKTDAEVIVSCGVRFMAESAKILSPDKMVLLPDLGAGCPMADMVTAAALREKKQQHPGAMVVCYVNSSAEVKAESDICCTSSNAIDVVNSLPGDQEIIFVPDRNLGKYVASQTGREMILWEGYCPIHDILRFEEVEKQKSMYPGAKVVVHPECSPEVIQRADEVCSTAGILNYIKSSPEQEFIVGTEEGFLHTVEKKCTNKYCYVPRNNFICEDMKKISLEKIVLSLEELEFQVEVPEDIRKRAFQALNKMLAV